MENLNSELEKGADTFIHGSRPDSEEEATIWTKLLDEWLKSFGCSHEAVEWHMQSKNGHIGGHGEYNVSLVEHSVSSACSVGQQRLVSFVHWRNVQNRTCQIVRTDPNGCFVTIVPTQNPIITLDPSHIIVIPDIGERAERRRAKGMRIPVPTRAKHLRIIWQAAVDARVSKSTSHCHWCQAMGIESAHDASGCCFCMHAFHSRCEKKLVAMAKFKSVIATMTPTRSCMLPAVFKEAESLCLLCKTALRI